MWKKKAKATASDATNRRPQSEASGSDAETGTGQGDKPSAGAMPPVRETETAAPSGDAGTRQRAATVRQLDLALGQIVSVLMRSSQHKHYSLADLEWLVLPAVLSGQFRIIQAQPKAGAPAPVAVALWATVSDDVDKRLSDLSQTARLRPDEWRSGNIPWLMELIADARVQQVLLKELGETIFKGRALKMRVRSADGKLQIATLKGAAETKAS